MKRYCAVCGNPESDTVFCNRLIAPSAETTPSDQQVVICSECGFAYMDNLQDQVELDRHYTHSYASSEEAARYRLSLRNIRRFLQPGDRVLDIGCGAGHLLDLIRADGFSRIVGLDPSESACHVARTQHGLNVIQGSLFDNLDIGRYDFVILSHVLEHIADLPRFLTAVHKVLNDRGRVYVEVPDAHNFILSVEPRTLGWMYEKDLFAHFSPEHINYFSVISIRNLMTRLGFHEPWVEPQVSIMGVIGSVWDGVSIDRDASIRERLIEYVAAESALLRHPVEVIGRLVQTQQEVIVWGAGLHTQRLLGCTDFGKANICLFVDSNPALQGQRLAGIPIRDPGVIGDAEPVPIVISSRRSQGEIRRHIAASGLLNPVILLYPSDT